jgi:hypothetical protein
MVGEFLRSLADRPDDGKTVPRVRAYLEALGRPDVRYLVGIARGNGARIVTRYARAVLEAAGATVGTPDDAPAEPLLAVAGTSVAAIAYQLAATRSDLGEISRREGELLIAFVAHAEASHRVLLLTDAAVDARAPIHGALPDVVAFARGSDRELAAAIADAPERRPFVVAPREAAGREGAMAKRSLPYVVGGRDFHAQAAGSRMDLMVGDERYAALAIGPGDDPELAATGIVAGLAVATFGVRMRPEWVERGAEIAAARE